MDKCKQRFITAKSAVRFCLALVFFWCLLFPAEQVQAANKITLKTGGTAPDSVYVGRSYGLKVYGIAVKFFSSDKAVATIGMTTGKFSPVAPGTVKIMAKSRKTGTTVAEKTFKVLQRADSVSVAADSIFADGELYLSPKETSTLSAQLSPNTSTDAVAFYSSDKSVVTVGVTSGKVTAVANGTATITVCAKLTKVTSESSKSNKTATITVHVAYRRTVSQTIAADIPYTLTDSPNPPQFNSADYKQNTEIGVGRQRYLHLQMQNAGEAPLNTEEKNDYLVESSNTEIFTVSGGEGAAWKVTGVKEGTAPAVIKSKSAGTGTFVFHLPIMVQEAKATSLTVDNPSLTVRAETRKVEVPLKFSLLDQWGNVMPISTDNFNLSLISGYEELIGDTGQGQKTSDSFSKFIAKKNAEIEAEMMGMTDENSASYLFQDAMLELAVVSGDGDYVTAVV
ncbi:MAG: Ig-like domain-containing protein, partial [Lachnospiraceae bacterium]|nr:Ig-like domain-containing protein [Lachnospiraceae bacterium]